MSDIRISVRDNITGETLCYFDAPSVPRCHDIIEVRDPAAPLAEPKRYRIIEPTWKVTSRKSADGPIVPDDLREIVLTAYPASDDDVLPDEMAAR